MKKDKVIFDKAIYDAMHQLRMSSNYDTEKMMESIERDGLFDGILKPLNFVTKHDLLKATFVGFEQAKTPKEKLVAEIETVAMTGETEEPGVCTDVETKAYLRGLQKAANILNIPYYI